MTENNTLMLRNGALADVMTMGKVFAASGFFADARQEAQAIVKVIAGQEMGIPALMAMTKIYIIQGKVVVAPEIMAALIKKSGDYNYKVPKWTNDECVIDFYEHGEKVFTSSFSMEDAKRAKLVGKDNWNAYPRNMLFARALSNGARVVCPHVINGAYVPEEMGVPVNAEGDVIESVARHIEQKGAEPPPAEQKQANAWTRDMERATRFWEFVKKQNADRAAVLKGMGVADLTEYTGTPEEAAAIVQAVVKAKATATATHWTHDQKAVTALVRWAESELGMGGADVLTGLNVTDISHYTGSLEQAKAVLRRFVEGDGPPAEQGELAEGQ